MFAAALLNSQPMGFYAPAQIVRDARDHGVEVREPDLNHSDWDCTLEAWHATDMRVRLGLRQIKRCRREGGGDRILAARGNGYPDLHTLWRRTRLPASELEPFANGDAFRSLGSWIAARPCGCHQGTGTRAPAAVRQLSRPSRTTAPLTCRTMREGEHVAEDYASLSLSLKDHPNALPASVPGKAGHRAVSSAPATDLPGA